MSRWCVCTDRELELLVEGLWELADNDDPDEESRQWAREADILADEIESERLSRRGEAS